MVESTTGVLKMGNGNRSGLVEGTEKAAAASSLECDVGLGLRMQRTESFPSRRMMAMLHPLPPYHHHHHRSPSESMSGVGFGGDGGSSSGSGGPIYYNLSNQLACLSDIYDVVGAGSVSGGAVVVPRTLHPFTTDSSFQSSEGGGMPGPAKFPFTASQWQELERQTTIYKYLMASMPVPPELLIPISKSPSPLPASQSNMCGLDLRFSRSSDPEPWRCRRTDGKKWRCSRDVAPYQKYCERHAHKSRPRSRKPVELQAHHTHSTATATATITNNNLNTYPLVNLPANTTTAQAFQKPIFHIPNMVSSAATCGQPRCRELFMKGDPIPGSNLNQEQWHQLMQSSSREGLKSCNEEHNRNASVFQQHYGEEQESMNTNSYIYMDGGQRLQNQQPNDQCHSLLGPKVASLHRGLNADQTQTTRRFIDAWSSAEKEGISEISNRCSVSSSGKLPLSSLTLSMSGGNGIDEESANSEMSLGMMGPERESDGGFKSQWLNPVPWMGSQPGGPLGEALCLGNSNTAKAASNAPSPHGYSNSTTTSSCSKSSCEDSGHGFHFH